MTRINRLTKTLGFIMTTLDFVQIETEYTGNDMVSMIIDNGDFSFRLTRDDLELLRDLCKHTLKHLPTQKE